MREGVLVTTLFLFLVCTPASNAEQQHVFRTQFLAQAVTPPQRPVRTTNTQHEHGKNLDQQSDAGGTSSDIRSHSHSLLPVIQALAQLHPTEQDGSGYIPQGVMGMEGGLVVGAPETDNEASAPEQAPAVHEPPLGRVKDVGMPHMLHVAAKTMRDINFDTTLDMSNKGLCSVCMAFILSFVILHNIKEHWKSEPVCLAPTPPAPPKTKAQLASIPSCECEAGFENDETLTDCREIPAHAKKPDPKGPPDADKKGDEKSDAGSSGAKAKDQQVESDPEDPDSAKNTEVKCNDVDVTAAEKPCDQRKCVLDRVAFPGVVDAPNCVPNDGLVPMSGDCRCLQCSTGAVGQGEQCPTDQFSCPPDLAGQPQMCRPRLTGDEELACGCRPHTPLGPNGEPLPKGKDAEDTVVEYEPGTCKVISMDQLKHARRQATVKAQWVLVVLSLVLVMVAMILDGVDNNPKHAMLATTLAGTACLFSGIPFMVIVGYAMSESAPMEVCPEGFMTVDVPDSEESETKPGKEKGKPGNAAKTTEGASADKQR